MCIVALKVKVKPFTSHVNEMHRIIDLILFSTFEPGFSVLQCCIVYYSAPAILTRMLIGSRDLMKYRIQVSGKHV